MTEVFQQRTHVPPSQIGGDRVTEDGVIGKLMGGG
jgi:hypothetical protein